MDEHNYGGTVLWTFAALLIASGAFEPVLRALKRRRWEPLAIQTLRAAALQLEDLATEMTRLGGRDVAFDRPALIHPSRQTLERMKGELLGDPSGTAWKDADKPSPDLERQLEHLTNVLWPRLVEALDDADLTYALGRLEDGFRHWSRDGQEHAAAFGEKIVEVYTQLLTHDELIEKQPTMGIS